MHIKSSRSHLQGWSQKQVVWRARGVGKGLGFGMLNYCSTETSYTTYHHWCRPQINKTHAWYVELSSICRIEARNGECEGSSQSDLAGWWWGPNASRNTPPHHTTPDHTSKSFLHCSTGTSCYTVYYNWCRPQINKTHAWYIELSSICRIEARNEECEGSSQSDLAGWWWGPNASRNTPPHHTTPDHTSKSFLHCSTGTSCYTVYYNWCRPQINKTHAWYIELSSICRIDAGNGECEGSSHCWGCWRPVEVEE